MAANPSLLCLRGQLVVVGKSPDGDSIRFRPQRPALLERLRRNDRVRVSRDGTVQLRLDGIDAPETHYGVLAQPLGAEARDALLEIAGFREVVHDGETVTSATPATVPAAVLSGLADVNGRPVAFVLAGARLPRDGDYADLTPALLARTINAQLLDRGAVYLTLYDSLAPELRARLRERARAASAAGRGVWAVDDTAEFRLRSQEDIGPGGQLILPKLFRRASDYLRTRRPHESLPHWIATHGDRTRPEDDGVLVGRVRARLSDLVEQRNDDVAFSAALLDIVFLEK